MRSRLIAVLVVCAAPAIATAEPPSRSPVIGGIGLSRAVLDPGPRYYLPDTLSGSMPWAYVGWRVDPDVAITADGWLYRADGADHNAYLWGGAAGVRYQAWERVQLAARLGYGHVQWNDSDGGYHDDEHAALGAEVGVTVIRDQIGALVVRASLTTHPRQYHDETEFATLYALGLGFER